MPASGEAAAEAFWPPWPEGDVDRSATTIHLIRVPLPTDGVVVPSAVSELNPDEVARAERYLVEPPRRQFVATRAALRRLCGAMLSLAPRDVVFEFAQFGKPAVAAVQNPHGLTFNVSHSGAWAVIAIGWQRRIGVDIETQEARRDWRGLAERFFSTDERRQLAALPEPLRHAAFYRIWTSKEAYLKATGLGMSLPLEDFTVAADPNIPPQVLSAKDDPSASTRWAGRAFSPDGVTFGTLLWDGGAADVRQWTWH
jgi:4'-phosphopantetheinyl transferase